MKQIYVSEGNYRKVYSARVSFHADVQVRNECSLLTGKRMRRSLMDTGEIPAFNYKVFCLLEKGASVSALRVIRYHP
jgi:hypothetical protein